LPQTSVRKAGLSAPECCGPAIRLVYLFLPLLSVMLNIQQEQVLITFTHQGPRQSWCHIPFCLAFYQAKKIEYLGKNRVIAVGVCGQYGEDVSSLYGRFEEQKELELRREARRGRGKYLKKPSHRLTAGGITYCSGRFFVFGFFLLIFCVR